MPKYCQTNIWTTRLFSFYHKLQKKKRIFQLIKVPLFGIAKTSFCLPFQLIHLICQTCSGKIYQKKIIAHSRKSKIHIYRVTICHYKIFLKRCSLFWSRNWNSKQEISLNYVPKEFQLIYIFIFIYLCLNLNVIKIGFSIYR